jgi:uncharacterized protein YdiU (UPF0061 family)
LLDILFDNTYAQLPETFFKDSQPESSSNPQLILFNYKLAEELGIDVSNTNDDEIAQVFSGNIIPHGARPIALAYAGHQFAHFVPQLGDGRAVLLGEVVNKSHERFDIQLKGSGPTYYSRNGDGKSSLGPVLREYLLSEAMHRLGVPTTRALCATLSGDQVQREKSFAGGIFTRVAPSHIRVGSFEYFSSQEDPKNLVALLHFSIKRHFPHAINTENPALSFLSEVIKKQAHLTAKWMSVGFIHGVMNTDNSAIAGVTLDYGPCAFMDQFHWKQVYSYIDRQGRYAYGNQPEMALWNLTRLADCLVPLIHDDQQEAVKLLEAELQKYSEVFEGSWLNLMKDKIGLYNEHKDDFELIQKWLNYLQAHSLDFTLSHRKLPTLFSENINSDFFPKSPEFDNFFTHWSGRTKEQNHNAEQLTEKMNEKNPIYIPRNHKVEEVIQAAYNGDLDPFKKLVKLLENPFTQQDGYDSFALPPNEKEIVENTFCGT